MQIALGLPSAPLPAHPPGPVPEPLSAIYAYYSLRFRDPQRFDIATTRGARPNNFVIDDKALDAVCAIIIGEAPGHDEVVRGLPFVGDAGRNLRSCIPSGWEERTWITNAIKHRPIKPGATGPVNRTPTGREIAASRPYLLDELTTVGLHHPILTVGRTGVLALLPLLEVDDAARLSAALKTGMAGFVNRWHTAHVPGAARPIRFFAVYHTSPLTYSGNRATKKTASIQDGIAAFFQGCALPT